MRLLIVSDIHGDASALESLLERRPPVQAILIAGDLTDFGGSQAMADIIEVLKVPGLPIVAVPGNCDRPGARRALEESGLSIDGKKLELILDGIEYSLFGSGGGNFRTGLTPYERKEADFEALFASFSKSSPSIVITHAPPFGTDADLRMGAHTGSKSLRGALDELCPPLWICGHIHEARSVSQCGASLLVNPGSLRDGFYALAELDRPKANGRFRARAELMSLME
jgi:Icc-related predicted phosphoesterase